MPREVRTSVERFFQKVPQFDAFLSTEPSQDVVLGHGMTIPGTHHAGGAIMQSYVPAYFTLLDAWLRPQCGCQ